MMRRAMLLAGAGLVLIGAAAARPVTYALPPEKEIILPTGAGGELTQAQCGACHSLDYVQTQPRGKGPQFWKDAVGKMVKIYGAPIEPGDADAISLYLAKTYG
ncbi:cytochrome C [Sphingobium boeckii]|uniref:Mono/diheme cytochrome c family protein n=1 Tax=Sphingobium boeckii TaxID=1082345 RepID=A0A7W9EDU2_9SPHN|nr:cytochrome C [Sphingobium boeckii]MBB5685472.1 mono/diheme cytochrome c family protein [Sphingobium boeckii]